MTHVRDGAALACAGVAGWGVAPLVDQPGWSWPVLVGGVLGGAVVMSSGHRRTHRGQLLERANDAVAPLLGMTTTQARGQLRADRWTQGWPGSPRRVRVRYGTGKVKLLEAAVEIGDRRWAGEVARIVGARFGAEYRVAANDPSRGKLHLKLHEPTPGTVEEAETAQVARAKRVVDELLGGTATVTDLAVDDAGLVKRLAVEHEVGAKLANIGYRRRIERSLSVLLPGRWRAHWDMEADAVTFEVRPTLPESIWIPTLSQPDEDPLTNYRAVEVPYGVDEDGEVMTWRPAVTPQWLITGGTGTGKTSLTHGILARITQYGWPVWIADGKGVEFLGFRDWPNIQVVASRIEQQVAVIRRAWELMEYRYQLVVDGLARTEDFEPLIVFVDEFTDLKHNLLAWYATIKVKGDPTKPPTLGEVGSIARKGRTSRVHLVLAMQRPDTEFFGGGEARDNFGQRTSMGPLSPDGAQMMWNNPVTGVALPRGRIGRAVGVNAAGVPVEMQCYRVPDPKDALPGTPEHELLMQLRPAESHQERLVIVPPSIDWTGEDPVEPTFSDFARAEWVRAEDRPDLDPLANEHPSVGGDGRALSSPMALLGLTGTPPPADPASKRSETTRGRSTADGMSPAPQLEDPDDLGDLGDGYGSRTPTSPASLRPGDLVCVDEDADEWAVVEEEPMPDFDDDDAVVVAWRDDQDTSGQLIVAAEAQLAVRRPLEVV